MLEKIKQAIFQKYKKTDNKGLFISAFDNQNELIMSNGVISSDKELDQLVDTIYHGLIEKHKNISNIVIDIVSHIEQVTDMKEINSISLKDYGLVLITDAKMGVLLPDTKGISDIPTALKVIKEKNGLEGNANIIKFSTDRFSV